MPQNLQEKFYLVFYEIYKMLKKNIGLISLAFLVFFSESLTAKVFFWDGRDGQRYYSDQDPKGIEANEMPLTGDTFYSVIKVYDGDTVLLGNRLKVRLLSINTPEIERYNKPEEAGGESAREGLIALLGGQKVRLAKRYFAGSRGCRFQQGRAIRRRERDQFW